MTFVKKNPDHFSFIKLEWFVNAQLDKPASLISSKQSAWYDTTDTTFMVCVFDRTDVSYKTSRNECSMVHSINVKSILRTFPLKFWQTYNFYLLSRTRQTSINIAMHAHHVPNLLFSCGGIYPLVWEGPLSHDPGLLPTWSFQPERGHFLSACPSISWDRNLHERRAKQTDRQTDRHDS